MEHLKSAHPESFVRSLEIIADNSVMQRIVYIIKLICARRSRRLFTLSLRYSLRCPNRFPLYSGQINALAEANELPFEPIIYDYQLTTCIQKLGSGESMTRRFFWEWTLSHPASGVNSLRWVEHSV